MNGSNKARQMVNGNSNKNVGRITKKLARLKGRLSSGVLLALLLMVGLTSISGIYWMVVGGMDSEFVLSVSVSTLMITFPFALAIARLLPLRLGLKKGLRHGVVFNSWDTMEEVGETNVVVIGKNGTLTKGKPELIDFEVYNYQLELSDGFDISEEENQLLYEESKYEILADVASIESIYNNPIGEAVVQGYKSTYDKKIVPPSMYQKVLGKGITGVTRSKRYYIGNKEYMDELGIDIPDVGEHRLTIQGKTVLYIARGVKFVGLMAISDNIRYGAKETITRLKELGYKVVLATVDTRQVADYIAKEVGIKEIRSNLKPDGKEGVVKEWQAKGYKVLMVDCGLHEKRALQKADVGVVLCTKSYDSNNSFGVVTVEEELNALSKMVTISRGVTKTIKQNIFWALVYNVLHLPLAMGFFYTSQGVVLSPYRAGVVLGLGVLSVVFNSIRVNRKRVV